MTRTIKPRKSWYKNAQGSSLVELLVGGMVFAIVFTSIFSGFSTSREVLCDEVLVRKAYQKLESILETRTQAPCPSLFAIKSDTTLMQDSTVMFMDPPSKAKASVELYIVRFSGGGIDDIPVRKVRTILEWEDKVTELMPCTLETYVSNLIGVN